VLVTALTDGKTVNIMAKGNKRHSEKQIVSKTRNADPILAPRGDVNTMREESRITEVRNSLWRTRTST